MRKLLLAAVVVGAFILVCGPAQASDGTHSVMVQVPEPCTVLLLGSGLAGVIGFAWRKNGK